MILVLADDFSGAAEIAGIGWKHGLNTFVCTSSTDFPDSDMLVIDTNTRSANRAQAQKSIAQIVNNIDQNQITWIYKKTDSVLRGNVIPEMETLLAVTDFKRVMLLPANPSKQRFIEDGTYFIDDKPIDQTIFARDPLHPIKSSDVVTLLSDPSYEIEAKYIKKKIAPSDHAVNIGETTAEQDLVYWAQNIKHDTLAAGASDFFYALLKQRSGTSKIKSRPKSSHESPVAFYVIGSTAGLQNIATKICRMPAGPDLPREKYDRIIQCLVSFLKKGITVALVTSEAIVKDKQQSLQITFNLVKIVQEVLHRTHIDHMGISGGDTASQIVRTMGWQSFVPVALPTAGVVTLKVRNADSPLITVKPGSYPWPESLNNQN